MADIDLSAQFDKISERAIIASGKIRLLVRALGISSRATPTALEIGPAQRPIDSRTRLLPPAIRPRRTGRKCVTGGTLMSTRRGRTSARRKPRPTPTWPRSTPRPRDFVDYAVSETPQLPLALSVGRFRNIFVVGRYRSIRGSTEQR
jgi:hypothetical protein